MVQVSLYSHFAVPVQARTAKIFVGSPMAKLEALQIVLQQQADDLIPDVWMLYVNRPCPDPFIHQNTGWCIECENKLVELERKDVPLLTSMMRLALSTRSLYGQVSF